MRSLPRNHAYHGSSKPFRPAVGKDFVLVDGSAIDARNRGLVALAVVSVGGLSVGTTGLYGFTTGDFNPLQAVWMIAAPFMGAIVAYYFGTRRTDTS